MIRILSILTVIFNLLIIVGVGHGIGVLCLIEIIIPRVIRGTDLNFFGDYDQRLPIAAILAAIGQIALIISLFLKSKFMKNLRYFSIGVLLISFYTLTKDWSNSDLDRTSFFSGIPFLIFISFLLFVTFKGLTHQS